MAVTTEAQTFQQKHCCFFTVTVRANHGTKQFHFQLSTTDCRECRSYLEKEDSVLRKVALRMGKTPGLWSANPSVQLGAWGLGATWSMWVARLSMNTAVIHEHAEIPQLTSLKSIHVATWSMQYVGA